MNTVNNTRWAENNFLTWARVCNKRVPDDPVPLDLLKSQDADLACQQAFMPIHTGDAKGRWKSLPSRNIKIAVKCFEQNNANQQGAIFYI